MATNQEVARSSRAGRTTRFPVENLENQPFLQRDLRIAAARALSGENQ
jgi:hypothetical protein